MRISIVLTLCLLAATATGQKPQTLGTSQMPGNICKFNQEYTLGKKTGSAMNVSVLSAEYSATRLQTGKYFAFPGADSKLLVVKLSLHNPLPKEQWYQKFILFTAVTSGGQNIESKELFLQAAPHDRMDLRLKPGQKVFCYTYFEVPAEQTVDKVILENLADRGSLVARYPMTGLIKKLEPPYADPNDPTGATPLKVMRVKMGETYEIAGQDVSVLKIEQFDGDGGYLKKPSGKKVYVLITFQLTCRNQVGGWITNIGGGWLYNQLTDADGNACGAVSNCLKTSSVEPVNPRSNFGEPVTFRKAYVVDRGTKLDFVRLKEFKSREIRFDLEGFTPS